MSEFTYDAGYWRGGNYHRFEVGYDITRPWVRPSPRLRVGFIRSAGLNSYSMTGRWIETAHHWHKHDKKPLRRFG